MNGKYSLNLISYLVTEGEMTISEIESMSRSELFEEVLCLRGYTMEDRERICEIVRDVFNIDLEKIGD